MHDNTYEVMGHSFFSQFGWVMGHSVTAGTTRCADRRVVQNLAVLVGAIQLCYNAHTSMLLRSGGAVLLTDVWHWACRRPSVSPPPHMPCTAMPTYTNMYHVQPGRTLVNGTDHCKEVSEPY
jgi:hypothetical protein